jgi:amino acid adenylation domain-containing protein
VSAVQEGATGERWSAMSAEPQLLAPPTAPERAPAGARTLRSGFLRSSAAHPDRPALEVGGETLTYAQLRSRAASIAATLQRHAPDGEPPLTALLAARTVTAFAGVLGILMRGHGYVPLNPRFPSDRSRSMLERARCGALLVDLERVDAVAELLDGVERRLVIVVPELRDTAALADRLPGHTVLGTADLVPGEEWDETPVDPNGIGYLLFTSGSTGQPKGVMVAHRNVVSFVDVMTERYGVTEHDRFSQTFDLTFDLSAFDMFVTWESGACLCCPPESALMSPAEFIREAALTVWFSVPSTGVFMRRLRSLTPGAFPSLRLSLFCGEPLPIEVAKAWAQAAPASAVENLYGPTELTIACTLYRWDPERSPEEAEHGVVPIGEPYPGMRVLVADESLRPVAPGEAGELLLTGPQVTLGYWEDPERTAAAFVVPPGEDVVFYRTGDRVRRAVDGRPMTYLGRVDHQIKILGHRVELGEVEAALREASGVDAVVALGWPRTASGASAIAAFVGDLDVDAPALLAAARKRLPAYMVPRAIHRVAELPLNANGKFDRRALLERLEKGDA